MHNSFRNPLSVKMSHLIRENNILNKKRSTWPNSHNIKFIPYWIASSSGQGIWLLKVRKWLLTLEIESPLSKPQDTQKSMYHGFSWDSFLHRGLYDATVWIFEESSGDSRLMFQLLNSSAYTEQALSKKQTSHAALPAGCGAQGAGKGPSQHRWSWLTKETSHTTQHYALQFKPA